MHAVKLICYVLLIGISIEKGKPSFSNEEEDFPFISDKRVSPVDSNKCFCIRPSHYFVSIHDDMHTAFVAVKNKPEASACILNI
jgi:hypothetical protein